MSTQNEAQSSGLTKVVAVIIGIAAVVWFFSRSANSPPQGDKETAKNDSVPQTVVETYTKGPPQTTVAPSAKGLPLLLDLGSTSCLPCKRMAPILAELKKDFAGKLSVEVVDVNTDKVAGKKYGVELIPTQIFFDVEGKERFRHTGFLSREDILGQWKELGFDFEQKQAVDLIGE